MSKKITADRELKAVHHLMSRIYRLLNSGDWSIRYADLRNDLRLLKKLGLGGGIVGYCDSEEDVLYVDYREDVLATIVHECLHALYPDVEEPGIKALEKLVMDRMSPIQAKRLHLIAAGALCR